MRCDCISLSEPALHPASCCRCPGNSSLCTLGPQHKEYHRHGQGSPSGTVIHILSGLPRGRCLEPSSPESPQDGESANTPLRASVTESPSSRSDPPAALSVRGLAWGGGGGWGSRVHGIKVVLRTRYQEGFHLALPVTFSPRPLPKSLRSLVLKVWSWDSSISFTWQLVKNAPQAWCIKAGVEPSNL